MNCQQARERLGDPLDFDPATLKHLEECADCRAEYENGLETIRLLMPARKVQASPGFKEHVVNQVVVKENRRAWIPRIAWMGAAAAALLIAIPVIGTLGNSNNKTGAAVLLAQSTRALAEIKSVHISAHIRTLPRDSFDMIDLQAEPVAVEMWKEFGDVTRWRVEKPGRVVVMNGTDSVLFIQPDQAVRGGRRPGFAESLMPLLNSETILERELAAIRDEQAESHLDSDSSPLVLTVRRKARGDFRNTWALNRTITESDHTCIYRFDPETKRLVGLQVIVHKDGSDITALSVDSIRYNEAFDPALFTLQLPEHVVWHVPSDQMKVSARELPQSPKEAARLFFDSFANEDWQGILAVLPQSEVRESTRKLYGKLEVLSIGEPFQSGLYRGWFVPYEVRLADGYVKKFKLAVRNDNPERRWVVDGGY